MQVVDALSVTNHLTGRIWWLHASGRVLCFNIPWPIQLQGMLVPRVSGESNRFERASSPPRTSTAFIQ